MSQRALDLYAEAGPAIGYGHVRRCLSIAGRLRDAHGVTCRFVMPAQSDAAPAKTAGFPVRRLDCLTDLAVAAEGCAALVVDSPNLSQREIETLSAAGIALAVFDDGRRLDYYTADVVIDSSPAAPDLGYAGPSDTRFCLGAHYFPLRAEFLRLRRDIDSNATNVDHLVVTFGGAEPDDATARVADTLAAAPPPGLTTFVLGRGYRGRLVAPPWPAAELRRDVAYMADLLAGADIAISGAGGTAMELAYLGVPALLIALSDDQTGIAQSLDAAGAARSLGGLADVSADKLRAALAALIADTPARAAMARRAQAMVDGKGLERICAALAERLLRDLAA